MIEAIPTIEENNVLSVLQQVYPQCTFTIYWLNHTKKIVKISNDKDKKKIEALLCSTDSPMWQRARKEFYVRLAGKQKTEKRNTTGVQNKTKKGKSTVKNDKNG